MDRHTNMERKLLNRIKVVLAEKDKSNKWLSEQLDKDPAIISKWVTNTTQPKSAVRLLKTYAQSTNKTAPTAIETAFASNISFSLR